MTTESKQSESKSAQTQKRKPPEQETAEPEAAYLLDELGRLDQLSKMPGRSANQRLHQAQVLHLQRTYGNQAVQRLINRVRQTKASETVQRIPAGQPSPNRPSASPSASSGSAAATGSTLATTAATALSRLPVTVTQDHNSRYHTGDHLGALMAVVRHMESQGDINTLIMAPPTAGGRQAICANTNRYIVTPSLGSSALATKCGCIGSGGAQLPNVRIEVGPGAIRNAESLHSTLFHEFRHVRQEHEQCNMTRSSSGIGGVVTDCNNPEEMDAYLAEAEAGYENRSIRHAWVRVYVNWPWLAPEQQQVFMARQRSVRRKVDRLFPSVNWAADSEVARYEANCQRLDRLAGGNTYGTGDSPMAPLSAPGPRSGGPIPTPPPIGDFPTPPEHERVA